MTWRPIAKCEPTLVSRTQTFGVCAFAHEAAKLGVPSPVSIQNDFSLCYRKFEGELAEACSRKHHNVSLLVYGAVRSRRTRTGVRS